MDDIKYAFDALAIGTWGAVLLGAIPTLTTVAALVWMCIRIYDGILSIRLKRRELEKKNDQQPKP